MMWIPSGHPFSIDLRRRHVGESEFDNGTPGDRPSVARLGPRRLNSRFAGLRPPPPPSREVSGWNGTSVSARNDLKHATSVFK